jgi:hypothetical protein
VASNIAKVQTDEAMRQWADAARRRTARRASSPCSCGQITTAVPVCSSCGERLYLRDAHMVGSGAGNVALPVSATGAGGG